MAVGRTIGKYRILEQIGRGGMGTVYKAVDETLDRIVAIKMINADNLSAETMQRFRSEAVTLARLNHPRIATIHELTRDDHDLLMVMEYAAGETLEKLVARTGALPVTQAAVLCDQILDALEHAHAAGIVHRDLKPSNLMVTPAGEVKVMDFGIARIAGSEHLTTDGYMMGTPAYMAPEQVRGAEVDGRTDLYAVAVVLYRLLTHQLPFRADTPIALIQSHLNDPPTPVRQVKPDLPAWIDEVLARGLAKAPGDRFQSATEFRQALEHGLNGTLATSAPWFDKTSAETYAVLTPTGLRTPMSRAIPPATAPFSAVQSSSLPLSVAPPTATLAPTATLTPTQTPTRTEPTVTLGTRHLAVGAVLLGLLVVGVAVLAYAALWRPVPSPISGVPPASAAAANPPTAPIVAANAPSVNPPSAGEVPASTAAPQPPVSAPPAPAPPVAPTVGSRGTDAAKKTPAAVPAAVVPAAPGSTAKAATGGKAKASSSPAPAAAPSDPSSRGESEPARPPASATTESFGAVKAVVSQGEGTKAKGRELDALLSLEPQTLVVRSRDSGGVLKTLPYSAIAAATYTQSKRPKGSDAPTVMPIPENFGGSGFFLGTAKHWLTLQSKSDFLILRLDDKNARPIMMGLESRTGIKTQIPDKAK